MMKRRYLYSLMALLAALISYCLLSVRVGFFDTKVAVSYSIIKDSHEAVLNIGIDKTVQNDSLIATLTKAANEHQYDGRDYYLNQHLIVKAYLVNGGQVSRVPAGVLARFVLPLSKEGKEIINKPLRDFIFTSLTEAKIFIE